MGKETGSWLARCKESCSKFIKNALDNAKYVKDYGAIYPGIVSVCTDTLKPLLGDAAFWLLIFMVVVTFAFIALFLLTTIKPESFPDANVKKWLPGFIKSGWAEPFLAACAVCCLILAITTYANTDKKDGFLAETFTIVRDLQRSLGIVSEHVATIKSTTDRLLAKSETLDGNIAQLLIYTKELQRGASNAPRHRLGENNIPFTRDGFDMCLNVGDMECINLFLKAGLDLAEKGNRNYPILFDIIRDKRKNYDKILLLAMEYGFDPRTKRYSLAEDIRFHHSEKDDAVAKEFVQQKVSFFDLLGMTLKDQNETFAKLLGTLGADLNRLKKISYITSKQFTEDLGKRYDQRKMEEWKRTAEEQQRKSEELQQQAQEMSKKWAEQRQKEAEERKRIEDDIDRIGNEISRICYPLSHGLPSRKYKGMTFSEIQIREFHICNDAKKKYWNNYPQYHDNPSFKVVAKPE